MILIDSHDSQPDTGVIKRDVIYFSPQTAHSAGRWGLYTATITSWSVSEPAFTLFPTSTENPVIARTRSIANVHLFLATARFPVTRYRLENGQHIVEYQEYGLSWRPVLRVVLDERHEVVTAGRVSH